MKQGLFLRGRGIGGGQGTDFDDRSTSPAEAGTLLDMPRVEDDRIRPQLPANPVERILQRIRLKCFDFHIHPCDENQTAWIVAENGRECKSSSLRVARIAPRKPCTAGG